MARASYWSNLQKNNGIEAEQEYSDNVSEITQGFPADQTQFQSANINEATLEPAPAPSGLTMNQQAEAAGLGPGGIAPPPGK
jgi:hypothetical protein